MQVTYTIVGNHSIMIITSTHPDFSAGEQFDDAEFFSVMELLTVAVFEL